MIRDLFYNLFDDFFYFYSMFYILILFHLKVEIFLNFTILFYYIL